jgi:hypothetical protein
MDRVVGETREVVENFLDVHFGFFRAGQSREAQHIVDNAVRTARV